MNNTFDLQENEIVNVVVFIPTMYPTISPTYAIMEENPSSDSDASNNIPKKFVFVIVLSSVLFFCIVILHIGLRVFGPRHRE